MEMGTPMRIIAGPCQHESLEQSQQIAEECQWVCDRYNIDYYFKASFDKANRTKLDSKRGVGIERTMEDFAKISAKTLTDVHETTQIDIVKDVVDVIQIPAFLSRQTDLIVRACETDCIVNIKKGQFLSPLDIENVLDKTQGEVWITERGTQFGYGTVVDFVGLEYMNKHYANIVFDVTHACNNRDAVPGLARAGAGLGINNFFLEVHADPDNAPSDGHAMIALKDFKDLVKQIYHCYSMSDGWRWL